MNQKDLRELRERVMAYRTKVWELSEERKQLYNCISNLIKKYEI